MRGISTVEVLAAATSLRPHTLRATLGSLEDEAGVRSHRGVPAGWALTTEGRLRAEGLMARQIQQAGVKHDVVHAYERFLTLNGEVLQVCTDWQVRSLPEPASTSSDKGPLLNDHSDPDYDRAVLERLATIHRDAAPVLSDLTAALERFARYRSRLSNALDRALAGDVDWVTRPTIESYHSVWFQLHEDLLASLGRQRSDESRG